jgi:hypothetical protein
MNIYLLALLLFVAGFMENAINGWHTQAVAHRKTLQSFLSGFVYVTVWMVALKSIVENLDVGWLVLPYALGSGVGSGLLVVFSKYRKQLNATTSRSTFRSIV